MGTLTHEDLEKVGRFARLTLTEEEKRLFAEQLTHVLAYMATVNERVDTTEVLPTFRTVHLTNVVRPDKSRPSWPKEKVLANAPVQQEGFFHVPRVLEE